MATTKKKKPIKETVETTIEVIKPTDEELFLGAEPEIKTVKVVNYTALSVRYRVTNIAKNRIYELTGVQIGAILGMNTEARKQLKEGAQMITLNDKEGNNAYKIEVL